ncbi:MAG: hypothetical protein LBQ24_01830 [Candidatus Peribacteria bacterium]|nr:hypothetical protein [Candidatus Peribacteria bacterium]
MLLFIAFEFSLCENPHQNLTDFDLTREEGRIRIYELFLFFLLSPERYLQLYKYFKTKSFS